METQLIRKILCAVAIAVAFVMAAAPSSSDASLKMPIPANISDSLPWFAVREVSENSLPFTRTHLSQMAQKSERTAIVYFATWCIPCRVGIKKLGENAAELKKHNVQVVLVNIGERDEKMIQKWVEKAGASSFKVVSDPFKRLTEGFGLVAEGQEISLPRTIVVNKNLKPLLMLGQEGRDWPEVLWK